MLIINLLIAFNKLLILREIIDFIVQVSNFVAKTLLALADTVVECMDVLYMASQCKGEEILHALFVMESAALVQNHMQGLEAVEVDARVIRLERLDSSLALPFNHRHSASSVATEETECDIRVDRRREFLPALLLHTLHHSLDRAELFNHLVVERFPCFRECCALFRLFVLDSIAHDFIRFTVVAFIEESFQVNELIAENRVVLECRRKVARFLTGIIRCLVEKPLRNVVVHVLARLQVEPICNGTPCLRQHLLPLVRIASADDALELLEHGLRFRVKFAEADPHLRDVFEHRLDVLVMRRSILAASEMVVRTGEQRRCAIVVRVERIADRIFSATLD